MKQLDPRAVWLMFFRSILGLFFGIFILGMSLAIVVFGSSSESDRLFWFAYLNWLWVVIPLCLIFSFVSAKLTYHFTRYELTDMGFRKESGIISKKYVTIPYDRIQNIDIYRTLLARILGLSDLHIQTAGMSAVAGHGATAISEGRLLGLSQETAEQLRDELIQQMRQTKNQGL